MSIEDPAIMMGHTDSRTTAAHYVNVNRRKQSEAFGKELNRLVLKLNKSPINFIGLSFNLLFRIEMKVNSHSLIQ